MLFIHKEKYWQNLSEITSHNHREKVMAVPIAK